MQLPSLLLVEDDPNDQELTRLALEEHRILNPIDVVEDGAEALDYIFARGDYADRAGKELPQVVLLDLKLPKLNGLDVLTRLREDPKTRYLPVVVFTSSREEQDIVNSYRLGANAYVRKPIDFSQFSKAVAQLGIFWVLMNEPVKEKRTAG
jgi:two-component system, response regulator